MNTEYLEHLAKKNNLKLKLVLTEDKYISPTFGNCCKSAFLKLRHTSHAKNYIILDSKHYVAVHIHKNTLLFYNSCGGDVYAYINKWAKKNNVQVVNMSVQLQHESSNKCGFFCLDFLINVNNAYIDFISKYQLKKLKLNDEMLIKL